VYGYGIEKNQKKGSKKKRNMKKSFKNRMKQALALVCLVWGMTLNVPVRAEETTPADTTQTETAPEYTVTIGDGLDGHTFAAYQIFKGDVADVDGKKVLSNVEWGDGVNSGQLIPVLQSVLVTVASLEGKTNAKDYAEAIANYSTKEGGTVNDQHAREIALLISQNLQGSGTAINTTQTPASVTLPAGYYLIVDTTEGNNANDFVWNESLLQLTGNMTINKKTDTPTVEKKVRENYDDAKQYQDVADYSIGDTIPFQITSTVPDTTHYKNYTYVFHDKLSPGLSLNEDTITVTIGGSRQTLGRDYTVETENLEDGCSFHVTVSNLKGKDDQEVNVAYTATLNNEALVGLASGENVPNTNTVKLAYSNHPNQEESFANTPEDKVLVLTYKLVGTKKETGTETTLPDAEFYLMNTKTAGASYAKVNTVTHLFEGWTTNEAEAGKLTSNENGTFEIQGLDAGTYYLKEIKAPTGYNIMEEPQEVQLIANKSETYEFGEGQSPIQFNTNDDGSNSSNKSVDNTGTLNVTVFNGKGFTMPSTGAFGQTLIYSVGGLMALSGLGIRLARRRHEKE